MLSSITGGKSDDVVGQSQSGQGSLQDMLGHSGEERNNSGGWLDIVKNLASGMAKSINGFDKWVLEIGFRITPKV